MNMSNTKAELLEAYEDKDLIIDQKEDRIGYLEGVTAGLSAELETVRTQKEKQEKEIEEYMKNNHKSDNIFKLLLNKMEKTKVQGANTQVKKALKWIIISGSATTILTGALALLANLESGEVDFKRFFTLIGFLVINGLINATLYWISQYKEG